MRRELPAGALAARFTRRVRARPGRGAGLLRPAVAGGPRRPDGGAELGETLRRARKGRAAAGADRLIDRRPAPAGGCSARAATSPPTPSRSPLAVRQAR